MTSEAKVELHVIIETSAEPSIAAVAQLLSGIAIMHEALSLAHHGQDERFTARLAPLRSPFLWMPANVLESCGAAWAILGDWPPMDPILRGGMAQGLLSACDAANAPRLRSIEPGSIRCILQDLTNDVAGLFKKTYPETKVLDGERSHRAILKDKMMAALEVPATRESGSPDLLRMMMPFVSLQRSPRMLAAGAMMFACQNIEAAYSDLGVRDVRVEQPNKGSTPKGP